MYSWSTELKYDMVFINAVLIESLATNIRILESKIFTKPTKIDVHKCSWNLILISQRSPAGILQNELIMILNFVLNWTKASSGKKNILWYITVIVSTWLIWQIVSSDLPNPYSTTCIYMYCTEVTFSQRCMYLEVKTKYWSTDGKWFYRILFILKSTIC